MGTRKIPRRGHCKYTSYHLLLRCLKSLPRVQCYWVMWLWNLWGFLFCFVWFGFFYKRSCFLGSCFKFSATEGQGTIVMVANESSPCSGLSLTQMQALKWKTNPDLGHLTQVFRIHYEDRCRRAHTTLKWHKSITSLPHLWVMPAGFSTMHGKEFKTRARQTRGESGNRFYWAERTSRKSHFTDRVVDSPHERRKRDSNCV